MGFKKKEALKHLSSNQYWQLQGAFTVDYDLDRFIKAQDKDFPTALSEIKAGKKISHWMWYVFPQLRGLGTSEMSDYYGLSCIDEAREYIRHPYLRDNLIEISESLLSHKDIDIQDILGPIDSMKLKSSMTLFDTITDGSVFSRVLDEFFDGERDSKTLCILYSFSDDSRDDHLSTPSCDDNIRIFNETVRAYSHNPRLIQSISSSIERQKMYLDEDDLGYIPFRRDLSAVKIIDARTMMAASFEVGRVCVLNFADYFHPGGCVDIGIRAQEECLCLVSTLYPCLSSESMIGSFYGPHRQCSDPLFYSDIIYTPDVTVFRTDTDYPETLPVDLWYNVDVITCAAPDIRTCQPLDEDLLVTFRTRFRRIIDVASLNRVDVLILGAFGCGVFGNDPEIVAEAARQAIAEGSRHCRIVFAIPMDLDSVNYEVFSRVFR